MGKRVCPDQRQLNPVRIEAGLCAALRGYLFGIAAGSAVVSRAMVTSFVAQRLNLVARITQPIDQLEVTQEGDIRVDAKHWSANADSASLQGGEGGANMRLPCLPWISELPECRTGLGIDHVGENTTLSGGRLVGLGLLSGEGS